MIQTPVLIVGAGPVGLGLALDLASRGIESLVIEREQAIASTVELARASGLNARTMELYRRWGLADQLTESSPLNDLPQSSFYCTALNGHLAGASVLPSPRETPAYKFSPQKRLAIPQFVFQPLMAKAAEHTGRAHILYGHKFHSLVQDENEVVATIAESRNGTVKQVRAKFLIACDGAGSTVRRHLDIGFPGDDLGESITVIVDIPQFRERAKVGWGVRYMLLGPSGTWGNFLSLDGKNSWRLALFGPGYSDYRTDEDITGAVRRAIGDQAVPFTVLRWGRWRRSQCIADTFRNGSVFLAGDAAHTTSPTGGHGLNTGMGDIFSLGWMLDAVLAGWGGPHLLDAYETERKPVARRNGTVSTAYFKSWVEGTDFSRVLEDSPEGKAERQRIGKFLKETLHSEWNSEGVAFGYRYDASPLIADDGSPTTPDRISEYIQTSRPGHRAPHAWMADGRSTIDLFGHGYVLLAFNGNDAEMERMSANFKRRGVPFRALRVEDSAIRALYEKDLVLVRPDGHVAWRGNGAPRSCDALIDIVIGKYRKTPEVAQKIVSDELGNLGRVIDAARIERD